MVVLKSILKKKNNNDDNNVNLNLDKKSIRIDDSSIVLFGEDLPSSGKKMNLQEFEHVKKTEFFGSHARRRSLHQNFSYEEEDIDELEDSVTINEYFYRTDRPDNDRIERNDTIVIYTLSPNVDIINMEENDISVTKGGVIPLSTYDMNYINHREIIHDPRSITEDSRQLYTAKKTKSRNQRSVKIDEIVQESSIKDPSNIDFKFANLSNYPMPYVENFDDDDDDDNEDDYEEGGKRKVSFQEHAQNKKQKLNDSSAKPSKTNINKAPLVVKPKGKLNVKLLHPNRGGLESVKIPSISIDY